MKEQLLTIGMAVYSDLDGAYFTLQSLHAHHPRLPYLVVDNAPASDHRLRDVTNAVGGTYLHRPDLNGTSAPRDAIFRLAKTPWAMCIDSHVLLEPGAVQALLDYATAHPDSNDLVQGPMVHDDGVGVSTHWRQEHPPGLWGVWDGAWKAPDGTTFTIGPYENGTKFVLRRLDGSVYDLPGFDRKMLEKTGDPHGTLRAAGCVLGGKAAATGGWVRYYYDGSRRVESGLTWSEPFDIPMQGLGLFASRCAAWQAHGGFNPLFRGFGGEEGYIHEKTRQAGGRCLCLPALRWRHKFRFMEHGAPPPPYPLNPHDHAWNLLVGHRELGVDALGQIRTHFGKNLPPGAFDALAQAAERAQPFGQIARRKRLKLLSVWYTHNQAPEVMLQASLASIKRAQDETMHHDVKVVTSTWGPVAGNPFPNVAGRPHGKGHAAIVEQVKRGIKHAEKGGYGWDAVCFLEHDVLIAPGYFDAVGNAFRAGGDLPPVVSNLDYEGMNATGFLRVKERHEPMHELSMRRDVALANLDRAEEDCKRQGWALLEPDSGEGADRSAWVRIPPSGLCPNIHINW